MDAAAWSLGVPRVLGPVQHQGGELDLRVTAGGGFKGRPVWRRWVRAGVVLGGGPRCWCGQSRWSPCQRLSVSHGGVDPFGDVADQRVE